MKRMSLAVFSWLALSASAPCVADETDAPVKMNTAGASVRGESSITATIVGIDPATRTVTLKTRTGKVIELEVTRDVRNFDRLAIGDRVTAQYREALTLSLVERRSPASRDEREIAVHAPPGAKPGGELGREMTILADVVAVNRETKIVTLRGPRGEVVDLPVADPEQLKHIRKGDQVKAVYTEALAISVESAGAK